MSFNYIYKVLLISSISTLIYGCTENGTKKQETVVHNELTIETVDYSQAIENYLTDHSIEGVIKTKEGIYIKIETEGSKEKPSLNNEITLLYKGYLLDHTVFDQTEGEVRVFSLNELIMGWKIGIPYIGKGGKCKLFIPPHFGYGSNTFGSIPGNSILVFDIELINFN